MPQMQALSPDDINKRLSALPQWKHENNRLVRSQTFPNYLDALEFVYRTGKEAEANDHHPDIFMNYKRVTVQYWTHKANGITDLDFKMAAKVEKIAQETYKGKEVAP